MSTTFRRAVCRILVLCMAVLPMQAGAAPIATDAVLAATEARPARASVRQFLERNEVAGQLEALGVSPAAARERANALTDAEVLKVAGQIDRLPVGADGAGVGIFLVICFLLWRFVIDPWLNPAPETKG